MKINARPSIYFSAYPLKAIGQEVPAKTTSEESPYLRLILSGKTKPLSKIRILPMVNPYTKPVESNSMKPIISKLPSDIELSEKEWYNNYE